MVTTPKEVWIIARSGLGDPYPCRCLERSGTCSATWCPCSGRVDYANLPPYCCASTNTPAAWKRADLAYQASRTVRPNGSVVA